jgi:hypothetical protein
MKMITQSSIEDKLVVAIHNLLHLPFPQICRHLVALDLLSILEQHGATFPPELADAICRAKDEDALQLIPLLKVVDKL